MAHYDAGLSLADCFSKLEVVLSGFCDAVRQVSDCRAQVYQLPKVLKGEESEEVSEISVIPVCGDEAVSLALAHYQRLFIFDNDPDVSSKAAVRLPGVLVLTLPRAERKAIQQQLSEINDLKQQLASIVTRESGVNKAQRFEFVHRQIKGLITLNAYRQIQVVSAPSSVRFGWANKNISQKVDRAALLTQLQARHDSPRAVPPYTRESWQAHLAREITALMQVPEDAVLRIRRPVKVQPVVRVWYSEAQKQLQYAGSSPVVVLNDESDDHPVLGDLPDYDAANIKVRHRPKAKSLIPVIPRLHVFREG